MSGGAITMMVIGMVIIWGGLIASITNAVVKAKQSKS
ncbi:methionine/alanine import family NSS transporter small subunit [Metabacillus arenae]|uniref:Methionine/alanine import family NSS transporter small subunit n=1 Tax=Metabacillus arenae TaxID=2771434 RepID=A0A926NN09_9BACI|nr:methionine/alanine import family NSS transporter small subunit [Metabacillus arenae]MBD1380811.1 methionine/alanine import family NSS transporter small subunit [Metabacillus arenae]